MTDALDASGYMPSRHNILAPLPGEAQWLLLNPLSRHADLLTRDEARAFEQGRYSDRALLAERGYLVDPAEEQRRWRLAYLEARQQREGEEVQLFFAPGYACNFNCSYCYQASYGEPQAGGPQVVDAFIAYIDRAFAGRPKYVTLFGGEPLLPSPVRRALIERLVDALAARGIELAVVTNGYTLRDYLPLLRRATLREVQVTLDGVGAAHDARRPLRGGAPTFDRVAAGVDALLAADVTVNLRVVVDRENIAQLVALADFAEARGWIGHPRFTTQIGRNYELHSCQVDNQRLYERAELYAALHALLHEHPQVLRFHRPAFSLARFLADNGTLPEPLFDACPGTKTEWAFDGHGRIYACTATVGKPDEALGRFYPDVTLDEPAVDEWQDRDVASIEACRGCNLQLACGGGCAAVAKNRTGSLHGADCRAISQALSYGADLYLAPDRPSAGG